MTATAGVGAVHTDTDVAARYGRSKWFVQTRCRAGDWPHLRVGKAYRFTDEHLTQIDALLEVGRADPAPVEHAWGRRPTRRRPT